MMDISLQGQNGSYKFDPRNHESRIADGMGVVYLGTQVETGKKVAIKVIYRELAQDEKNIERARREAAIKVNHSNLIKMYDFVEKDGIYHIISEYLEGQNLEEFIKQNPNINSAYAIRIINEVLNGLQALHSQNPPIIHRDIKPSNIFLCYDGTIKLLDFGIARITGGERKSLTGMGTVVGSPHYSPPEQVRGEINKINETTDIYAVGITLYELLTGQPPFDATNEFDILKKQVDEPLPKNDKIPKNLFEIIKKATSKQQNDRFENIDFFRDALKNGLGKPVIDNNNLNKGQIPNNNFEYAFFGQRFVGFFLDSIMFLTVPLIFTIITLMIFSNLNNDTLYPASNIYIISLLIHAELYFVVPIYNKGQTFGCKVAGIKYISNKTKKYPTTGQVWIRLFSYSLSSIFFYLGFLMATWDSKHQALHDKIAGTIVIKSK